MCYAFLLGTSYQNIHQAYISSQQRILHTLAQSEQYYKHELEKGDLTQKPLDILNNGVQSYAHTKNWGGYVVLTTTAWFKRDTIVKSILLGRRWEDQTALYLSDRGKPLKLAGAAKVKGLKYIPKGRLQTAFIRAGKNANLRASRGTQEKSSSQLPPLTKKAEEHPSFVTYSYEEAVEGVNSIYQAFNEQEVKVLEVQGVLDSTSVKGQFVIKSQGSLYIPHWAVLENVIVEAPIVTVGSGFSGSLQIVASAGVYILPDARLEYPSSIVLEAAIAKPVIEIHQGAQVLGGIALTHTQRTAIRDAVLAIKPGGLVAGSVYCKGSIALEGIIKGSVYADFFYLETKSGAYDNHILNGQIDRGDVPEFMALPTFHPFQNATTKYEEVKTL